jgi:hypothetical protein
MWSPIRVHVLWISVEMSSAALQSGQARSGAAGGNDSFCGPAGAAIGEGMTAGASADGSPAGVPKAGSGAAAVSAPRGG